MINMSSERTAMQKLYEASLSGSVPDLERLEEEDPLIVDKYSLICFHETLLHIAALRGHSDFTRALLSRKPQLATDLDWTRRSPLHLASAEGHVEIVRQLLDVSHDVCKARDEDGRTPLHLAAMKGRVEVIKQLIRARPESILEKLEGRGGGGGGETVLHLCVKYNRLEALRTFVDELRSRNEIAFVNSEDNGGNTVLHLAAALKQLDTIQYLFQVESVKEHANTKNMNGSTALDVVEHCLNRDLKNMEVHAFLLQVGVRRAWDLKTLLPASLTDEEIKTLPNNPQTSLRDNPQTNLQAPPIPLTSEEMKTLPDDNPQTQSSWKSITRYWNKYFNVDDGWFKEVRGHLITASTLTATMAYQAGLNPPGSVWQNDSSKDTNQTTNDYDYSHYPGTSIAASTSYDKYEIFTLLNTASLIASLSTLLLALSGFPPENKFLVFLLIFTMFCSITCMAFAYMLTLLMISPAESWNYVSYIIVISFSAWVGICIFVLLVHTSRFLQWLCRKYREQVKKKRLTRRSNENNVHPMPQSNFSEWLWQKYRELIQKRWPTRRRDENKVNPMPSSETTTGTGTFSISI